MSEKYIHDRFLPDKAIDLIDEAASKIKLDSYTAPDELAELFAEQEKIKNKKCYFIPHFQIIISRGSLFDFIFSIHFSNPKGKREGNCGRGWRGHYLDSDSVNGWKNGGM